MNLKIKITASARADIRDIKKWYAKESLWALENFTKELVATLEALQNDLQGHRIVYKNYHKVSLKKFPYIIYYQHHETENMVIVNALFHVKRGEEEIKKRLENE